MTFESTGVKADGDDWVLMGELTLMGVTKPVELELEFNGLIDDVHGWDFYSYDNDPSHPLGDTGFHGTRVSGAVGLPSASR